MSEIDPALGMVGKLWRPVIEFAAVTRDDKGVVSECADLLYHLLVLLKSRNLTLQDVVQELASRHTARG